MIPHNQRIATVESCVSTASFFELAAFMTGRMTWSHDVVAYMVASWSHETVYIHYTPAADLVDEADGTRLSTAEDCDP